MLVLHPPRIALRGLASISRLVSPRVKVANFSSAVARNPDYFFHPGFNSTLASTFSRSFLIHEDFISENEEASLMKEAQGQLKRLVYEKDHWDDVRTKF